MNGETERVVNFSEQRVKDWCEESGDQIKGQLAFNANVVPSMMLLTYLSGMVNDLSDDSEVPIISGVTAARFRDPVLVDESVHFHAEVEEEDDITSVFFEARVDERDALVANGVLNVVNE